MAKKKRAEVGLLPIKRYPRLGTLSAERYYFTDIEIANFLDWVALMAIRIDKTAIIAKKVLDEVDGKKSSAQDKDEKMGRGVMFKELKKNRLILLHMLHVRMIDNYLTYLSEVLVECFTVKPEVMKSSETIEVSEILQHNNYDEIVKYIAEKKVHSLSYQSITDLDNYFESRFGVNIVSDTDKDFLINAIETRNLITHNRGFKNKRYIQIVGEDESKIGKVRDIGIKLSRTVNKLLYNIVRQLDSSLRKKLDVPGHRFDILKSFEKRT